MKKLILILVIVFPFLANGQDYRVVDWKTDVLNVQTVGIDTFKFDAEPKDYNDAGAITREIGNYFIDYVARCFKIIGSDANTITVVDLEHINSAPQSNQIGRVYQSVVDADSLFESIGGVDISVLDQMSIYRDVARNNEIICRLLKELYLKDATYRQKTDHDSLSALDEKSYNSLTDKPASLPASDVYPWAKAATKPTYTKSEVGLSNVDNTNDASKPISTATQTALNNLVPYTGAISDLDMGANSISTDTVKIDGVPLLLNTFKKGNLGGTSNIFYSIGASSQPASGSINQVIGGNSLTTNYVPKWDGSKLANTGMIEVDGKFGIGLVNPFSSLTVKPGDGIGFEQTSTMNPDTRRWWIQNDIYQYGDFVIKTASTKDATIPNIDRLYINGIGNIGINKTDPSERLDVNGNVIADILKSRVPTGTAPLTVVSTTKVDNLNVGLLDGKKASDFQLKSDTLTFDATLSDLADSASALRSSIPIIQSGANGYLTRFSGTKSLTRGRIYETEGGLMGINKTNPEERIDVDGDLVADTIKARKQFISLLPTGTPPLVVASTTMIPNLNSNFLNGKQVSDFQLKSDTTTFDATLSDLADSASALRILANTKAIVSGSTNRLVKITGSNTLGNSILSENDTTILVAGAVNSTGGFSTTSKSNLNDVVGDSAVFANMKMTYGAGLNKIIYSDATGNFIWGNQSSTLLAIAGVTPSTGYLYYNGSTFSYASGGSAQWTADTYGIRYTSGKVGIGTGSDSGNLLTIGDPSTNTNIAIRAASINERAIYATSTNNTAITAQGSLDGVSGVGGRYGLNGASTNGAGIRGSSTYGYGGEFSGLGVNISSGNLDVNSQTRITSGGFFQPVSSTDAAAPNNSIYYSTTQSKLVYKNASGAVNVLY